MNHMPKSGGNAVAHHFKTLLGAERVLQLRLGITDVKTAADIEGFDFVYGHLPFSHEHTFAAGRQRFALIREPVARVLSAYFFYRQLREVGGGSVAGTPDLSLEEFLACGERNFRVVTTNCQARLLLGGRAQDVTDPKEARQYVAERERRLDRFFMVGLHERFQASLDLLAWHLRLPRLVGGMKVNETRQSAKSMAVGEHVIDRIRAQNAVDLALYDVVASRFDTAVDRMMEDAFSQRYFAGAEDAGEAAYGVDFAGPVAGSGWDTPVPGRHGTHRWMGGADGANLYFPGRRAGRLVARLFVADMDLCVSPGDITVFLDGRKMACTFTGLEAGGFLLTATVAAHPQRRGNILRLLTRTWRKPTATDSRALALAVSRAEIDVANPMSAAGQH